MKSKFLPVLLVTGLGVAGLALGGCSDPQAAQNASVRQKHQEVSKILDQALLTYVPGKDDVSLVKWRQDRQGEARQILSQIISEGTPRQQVMTRRLISDLADSAARQQLGDAISSWTELSNETALLMSYLLVVDRADSQLRRFSTDESELLATIRQQTAQMQQQGDTFEKDLAQWQAKAKDLTQKMQAARKQADEFTTQSARLREQAFGQTGADRQASYEKATEAQIKANKASALAQSLEAELGVANSTAEVLQRQVKLSEEAVAQGQSQVGSVTDEQAEQAKLREKALAIKQQAIEKLDSEIEKLVARHQQMMDQQFQPALDNLNQSIEALDGALALSTDQMLRRQVQRDLLARKVSKLHLLAMQAAAAGDWARKLEVVAGTISDAKRPGGVLIPGKTTFYQTTAQTARNQYDQTAAAALTTASEANELASQLTQAGEGDPIAAQASQLASLVTTYTRQVNASKG